MVKLSGKSGGKIPQEDGMEVEKIYHSCFLMVKRRLSHKFVIYEFIAGVCLRHIAHSYRPTLDYCNILHIKVLVPSLYLVKYRNICTLCECTNVHLKKTDGFVAEIRNDSNTNDTIRKQISS